MPSAEEIAALYKERLARLAPRHARMGEVSDVYYGRVELPLPELNKRERAAVPNLCRQGGDQLARRVASVLPNQLWPAARPGIGVSEERADLRRQVAYGWWEHSKMRKLMRRRARWFIVYASAPVVVRPDPKLRIPRWEPHSPFDIFPSTEHIDCYTPDNAILRHNRTLRWLKDNYPDAYTRVHKRKDFKLDDLVTCLEYIGPDEITWVVCGDETSTDEWGVQPAVDTMAVEMTPPLPNRAGMCWAVIPEQTCLDNPAGQFDDILGMYVTQAAMMALQIIAARKAIWPTTWLVNPNGMVQPHIFADPDPRTGTPGIVVNGVLDRQNLDPGFRGQEVIDRLEYSQRQTAGLPAELGGSGSQNVRTGRRGSQIMSASIDFTIAEAQDAMAEALHDENLRAAAIDRHYFNAPKTFYVSTKGARGKVEYKPSDIWDDSTEHIVEYPIAGTDLSDLVINGGPRVGMGTMSKRSFMEIDPLVSDADAEEQRVKLEGLEAAFFSGIQTLAANPEGPWQVPDLIRLAKKMISEDKVWWVAAAELQEEKQAEQAQGAPAGSPETMPGLAMPGQGAEVPPAIPGLGPASEDMTSLLSQLGVADMAVKAR